MGRCPAAEHLALSRRRGYRDGALPAAARCDDPLGRIPFGLRVASREDPAGSVVEEGTLTVSSYGANTAELLPRTARGRRGARYEIAVDNRGNSERTMRFAPTDPAEALSFQLAPPEVVVPPGSASFVKLRVRSKSFMRGQPKTKPFAVAVQPEGDAPIALDGTFLQEALLPKWLLPLLLALVALALIWFFLLKPEIKSQARDAVAQPIANANKKADKAQQAAQAAASKADTAAAAAAGKTPPKTTPTTTTPVKKPVKKPTATTSTANVLGSPLLGRLVTQCPPTCTAELKAAPKQTLSIADLILQNPEGDSGTLSISIRGTPELLFRLDNFRDYDYHFVAPPTLKPGDSMTITVVCQNKGKKACTAAVFWSGFGKRGKG